MTRKGYFMKSRRKPLKPWIAVSCLFLLTLLPTQAAWSLSGAEMLSEFRAVKLTNVDSQALFSDESIARAMDYLASININTVLVAVWNSSGANGDYTLYPSALMDSMFGVPVHPSFAGRDMLQRVIIEAHRNGMEVLPWFEMGFSTSYGQNGGHILQRYPHWALLNSSGQLVVKNGFDWMSPLNPEVQDFIYNLTIEVCENYDIDGVEYSDRIPAMPVEGGYEPSTVAKYKEEHDGEEPPSNFSDENWKRWRADIMNDWFQRVRDGVKAIDQNLLISSSPSAYPWAYDQYLQDAKSWIEDGTADNLIPQIYRYNYNDYLFELNKSLSFIDPAFHHLIYSGILIKVGSYRISPELLKQSLQANRDHNLAGEAHFFYEGLRDNGNELGDTLLASFYAEPALSPDRDGYIRRPKASIQNEDDPNTVSAGDWYISGIQGFNPNILICESHDSLATIDYHFNVPFSAYFDLYSYNLTGVKACKNAHYTLFGENDTLEAIVDQTLLANKGWQKLGALYLDKGMQKLITLDNSLAAGTEKLTADATMIMINRKLSPDLLISSIEHRENPQHTLPQAFQLHAYPNPFNPVTTIQYHLSRPEAVTISVYDLSGKQVFQQYYPRQSAGLQQITIDLSNQASAIYFCRVSTSIQSANQKLILLK